MDEFDKVTKETESSRTRNSQFYSYFVGILIPMASPSNYFPLFSSISVYIKGIR